MFVRLILALAIALGFSAGVAEACQCRPVHHVVRPRPKPACVPCRVVYRHRLHVHTRVIEKVVHIRKYERFDDRAYRFAETDQYRWGGAWGSQVWGPARASPPHPWDTDPNGYLTWPGKDQPYVGEDRYSGQPRSYDPRNTGCPDNCPLQPPPAPAPVLP